MKKELELDFIISQLINCDYLNDVCLNKLEEDRFISKIYWANSKHE